MENAFLDHQLTSAWLDQFSSTDRAHAAKLAATLTLVSADDFAEGIIGLLDKALANGQKPVALYNETEQRKWKGVPNRLFKEPARNVLRATGVTGPSLVPRHRTVDQEVGSEGVIANLLTQYVRNKKAETSLSPGPDTIRKRKIRRIILITDFIGSGSRSSDFLDAAWRVRSIRSWWSRRKQAGVHFEVIAFCGTQDGIDHVESHPCRPTVSVCLRCPTIDTVFTTGDAALLKDLCKIYNPLKSASDPLGYGAVGALIAFSHSMPNNAPEIFWRRTRSWRPLFPSRTTTALDTPFRAGSSESAVKQKLDAIVSSTLPAPTSDALSIETIVLNTLRRSPRAPEAVSGRIGLPIADVNRALSKLRLWGWIDPFNQMTDRGRLALRRLTKPATGIPLPKRVKTHYFPQSLRAPRGI